MRRRNKTRPTAPLCPLGWDGVLTNSASVPAWFGRGSVPAEEKKEELALPADEKKKEAFSVPAEKTTEKAVPAREKKEETAAPADEKEKLSCS